MSKPHILFDLREFVPDEHTPVSRELTAPPGAAIVASKSIVSIEFIELSAFFAVALAIFGLPAEAYPNFKRLSIEIIELSHVFAPVIFFIEKCKKSTDLSHLLYRIDGIRITVAPPRMSPGCRLTLHRISGGHR